MQGRFSNNLQVCHASNVQLYLDELLLDGSYLNFKIGTSVEHRSDIHFVQSKYTKYFHAVDEACAILLLAFENQRSSQNVFNGKFHCMH